MRTTYALRISMWVFRVRTNATCEYGKIIAISNSNIQDASDVQRQLLFGENFLLYTYIYLRLRNNNKNRNNIKIVYDDLFVVDQLFHLYLQLWKYEILFWSYIRMASQTFHYIITLIEIECSHSTTNFIETISIQERLLITLR